MRKVIVIGGSAGGIEGLCGIIKGLPGDLQAAALAVIHTTEQTRFLPDVIRRCGTLEVVSPENAAPVSAGCVYLPAPNRHLIVRSHCAISWMGPRENRHRPSVDSLFRTAARAYRNHVIAIVLSGALDDGSAGALAVKSRGGTVIVQDPKEAAVNDMPANVLRHVGSDYCLPISQIPGLLVKLVSQGPALRARKVSSRECQAVSGASVGEMEPTGLTCPDCGGAVLQIDEGKSAQFRCHVGHAFSLQSFSEAHADALERALWAAMRRLNEQRTIHENLARGERNGHLKKRYQENIAAADRDMRLLHEILGRL